MRRQRVSMILPLVAAAMCVAAPAAGQHDHSADVRFAPSVWGIDLPTRDAAAAGRFYRQHLGFAPVKEFDDGNESPVLANHGLKITFTETDDPALPRGPHLNINLSVPDLHAAVQAAKKGGATLLANSPLESAIGIYIPILDPDGNEIHLIELRQPETKPGDPPKLYNVGYTVTDMDAAEKFFTTLGFEVYSRKYLPQTLPLVPAGAAMIVLHPYEGEATPLPRGARVATLLLDSPHDGQAVRTDLKARGMAVETRKDGLLLHEPTGHPIRIIRTPETDAHFRPGAPTGSNAAGAIDGAAATALFETIKALEGTWNGHSTKGWEGTQTFTVMARGSAVMEVSEFPDDPTHNMVTVYHLDGERLMLTHYCAARNQPRLVASRRAADGAVLFEFMDGTNMASRDVGHMDSAEYRFVDADHFTSRWTWYQDGAANWMEDIRYERAK